MQTDLPCPVAPAISRCGIRVRSPTIAWPETSLPIARASFRLLSWKPGEPTTSRSVTRLADLLGTSTPTADLPGIGASIRSGEAARASARSLWRLTIRRTATPSAGWISYWVTAGPGLTPMTLPSTPNVVSVCSMIRTLRLISSCIRSLRAVAVSSRLIEGSFQSISGS